MSESNSYGSNGVSGNNNIAQPNAPSYGLPANRRPSHMVNGDSFFSALLGPNWRTAFGGVLANAPGWDGSTTQPPPPAQPPGLPNYGSLADWLVHPSAQPVPNPRYQNVLDSLFPQQAQPQQPPANPSQPVAPLTGGMTDLLRSRLTPRSGAPSPSGPGVFGGSAFGTQPSPYYGATGV